ncbi:putative IS1294 transposase [Escherichia coli]|uniref:Putative IS1294 transposase n=1 Tax=Escherichia coli TaxID=562 RepID=A0A377HG92_ECOLX|nr:putative IS1294 transposase [Escherichia coli]
MTRNGGDFQPRPLKRLFTANQCWTSFLDAGGLRDIGVEAVTKMLACGTRILGVKEYNCDKPDCPHVRYVTNSCGSRACPSCGKKATDLWIATQLNRLCQRQDYWPFFAIFNVRYWSLMLSAFRHFIITDWRGVFCQHSRFAFFL